LAAQVWWTRMERTRRNLPGTMWVTYIHTYLFIDSEWRGIQKQCISWYRARRTRLKEHLLPPQQLTDKDNFKQYQKRWIKEVKLTLESEHLNLVRSFLRGGVRPLAVFRRAFSLPPALRLMRPRLVVKPSLGLAQCAFPLTLGLVLYIYRAQLGRRVSLAGAKLRSSYI